jgi:hypothetical protein
MERELITFQCYILVLPTWYNKIYLVYFNYNYRCAPVSMGNTFQDLPRLHETVDNTEHYIHVTYINTVKFNW